MKRGRWIPLVILALAGLGGSCRPAQTLGREAARRDLERKVEEALPAVAALTGIAADEPVKVDVMTKSAFGDFFARALNDEYPDGALEKRGQCFAEIGALPRGYDLADGLLELLREQGGGAYDPRSKTLIGVTDLPGETDRAISDRMILSHELTHALQDRAIDILEQSRLGLENIDYEYALRAVIEGMASSVMLAYSENLDYGSLPDLQSFWRSNLDRAVGGVLAASPPYLKEYLFSPYAEGGAFLQSWLRENPGKTMKDLFGEIPPTSEQVLHFEKYAEGDQPAGIDLSGTRSVLPGDWGLFYANTLGEFDLLQLFRIHPETKAAASDLAAGWDGCRFEAYRDAKGGLVLIGSSAWDREEDAREFQEGFQAVLGEFREGDDYEVAGEGARVHFVIGCSDRRLRTAILESLQRGAETAAMKLSTGGAVPSALRPDPCPAARPA